MSVRVTSTRLGQIATSSSWSTSSALWRRTRSSGPSGEPPSFATLTDVHEYFIYSVRQVFNVPCATPTGHAIAWRRRKIFVVTLRRSFAEWHPQ